MTTTSSVSARRPLFSATTVLVACLALIAAAAAENTKHVRSSDIGTISPPQPFNISATCPPADCYAEWSGQNSPAAGRTDFTPAGVPLTFYFMTGNPLTWQCNEQYEYCEATYGAGGTFTVTGSIGTFTGQVTSGSAYESGQGSYISVTFTGKWSSGQAMDGTAFESYEEANGIPQTQLQMHSGP